MISPIRRKLNVLMDSLMTTPKIGFLCGSLRKESINKSLETALLNGFDKAGANTIIIDLAVYDLPLYHGDLNLPKGVKTLIADMKSCDGIVITSPEYNGGLTPVLKNAIDWTSTVETGHISGPIYSIASCSPGPMSGIMGMRQLQYILTRLGAQTIPVQVGCGNAEQAFDEKGKLIAEPAASLAKKMTETMLARISKI